MLGRSVMGALAVALVATASAQAVTGQEIVSYVNAQRAAAHIPAGIRFDKAQAERCAKHNHYEALNGGLTHVEERAKPGYTADGASTALRSVLYNGSTWTAQSNPFQLAPIHLAQVLAPRIDKMGAAESEGFGCATTLVSMNRRGPSKKVTYTYPANGAKGWPTSELAAEGPYTPGQRRGIPAGTVTGPYLLAMFDSRSLRPLAAAHVKSASLTDASGRAIHIKVADNKTSGLKGYLPTGAYIIPIAPLLPATKYTASITAYVGKLKFVHHWSFTTTP